MIGHVREDYGTEKKTMQYMSLLHVIFTYSEIEGLRFQDWTNDAIQVLVWFNSSSKLFTMTTDKYFKLEHKPIEHISWVVDFTTFQLLLGKLISNLIW